MENEIRFEPGTERCRRRIPVIIIAALALGALLIIVAVKQLRRLSPSPGPADRVFPPGFVIGCATSSYQVEGAWDEDGKGESIWDHFTHNNPERIADRQTGDVACDSYHKYKEDVRMLKDTGFDMYRFSISWPRVLPTGYNDVINQPGLEYYHKLIDELLVNDITPMVTLYHWDLPQPLQDVGGWTNASMADHFMNYARVVFQEFGYKVKWWITINEMEMVVRGYGEVSLAPGLDDHGVSDYLAAHNLLRAHAKVYRLYETDFKPTQRGKVGLSFYAAYIQPFNASSPEDQEAAERAMQFELGYFAHPVFSTEGGYPPVMRERVEENSKSEGWSSSRLPEFSAEELDSLKRSSDFFGLNHYITQNARAGVDGRSPSRGRDSGTVLQDYLINPIGFRRLLGWIKAEYDNPPVFITENGAWTDDRMNDTDRVLYYHMYMGAVLDALHEDGCHILGYTSWSLMDNFEWFRGYTAKFGLWHVNFTDPERPRRMKLSAHFMKSLLATRSLPSLPFTAPGDSH